MAIALTTAQYGNTTVVTAQSDLSGTVFYHWYIDGAYVARTTTPSYTFFLETGEQVRVDCIDTIDPDFDAIASAPEGYPARRTLWWVRSLATDVVAYNVYEITQVVPSLQRTLLGVVPVNSTAWTYTFLTKRWDDTDTVLYGIYAEDVNGNESTVTLPEVFYIEQELVRRPDAPDFTVSYDTGTDQITFAAA